MNNKKQQNQFFFLYLIVVIDLGFFEAIIASIQGTSEPITVTSLPATEYLVIVLSMSFSS